MSPTRTLDAAKAASVDRRWWVLAVMSLATLMVFIDNTVVNTAIPVLSTDLKASISELQWVIDGYTLVLAGLVLVGGSVGDRYGRRRWMIAGLVVFGIGAVGAALSGDVATLTVFRGVQGLGAALVLPATLSIITAVFPRGERAKAIAIWTAVGGLGIGIGPALGGYLVDELGWSSVFWMHLPVIGIALAGMLIVPESRDERRRRIDVPGAIVGSVGLGALVFGLIRAGEVGWSTGSTVLAFGAAIVLLGAFAVIERRVKDPMLPLKFFKQKDFTGAILVIGLIMFGFMVSFFFLAQFFQLVQGRSAFEAGLLLITTAVGMRIVAPISGILVKRIGPRALVFASAVAMVTGLLLLTEVEVTSSTFSVVGPLMLFGLGGGLGLPPLTDTVMAAVPVSDAGVGSAVNDVSRELGVALGVATIGSVVNMLYRSNLVDLTSGVLPEGAVEAASEGIGVAGVVAQSLPPEAGIALVDSANQAFIDAITGGFYVGAAFVGLAALVAVTLIPRRMRTAQLDDDPEPEPLPALRDGRVEAPVRIAA